MKAKISPTDLRFLLEHIQDSSLLDRLRAIEAEGVHLAKGKFDTGLYLLEISDFDAAKIVEGLTIILAESGFGEDWEPNALGYRLESLIDAFSPE